MLHARVVDQDVDGTGAGFVVVHRRAHRLVVACIEGERRDHGSRSPPSAPVASASLIFASRPFRTTSRAGAGEPGRPVRGRCLCDEPVTSAFLPVRSNSSVPVTDGRAPLLQDSSRHGSRSANPRGVALRAGPRRVEASARTRRTRMSRRCVPAGCRGAMSRPIRGSSPSPPTRRSRPRLCMLTLTIPTDRRAEYVRLSITPRFP